METIKPKRINGWKKANEDNAKLIERIQIMKVDQEIFVETLKSALPYIPLSNELHDRISDLIHRHETK